MKLRIADIDIYVGYEAVAALTAVLLIDRENRFICCLAAAVVHELGHMLMMRLRSVRITGLRLRLFDVLIEAAEPPSFGADVLITLGGPAANLAFAAVSLPFSFEIGMPQLALGVFNLLPAMSLDGGHLLRICLERRYSARVCDIILTITTIVFVLPLMTAGIYLLFKSKYNYSFLAISLYLLAVLLLKK